MRKIFSLFIILTIVLGSFSSVDVFAKKKPQTTIASSSSTTTTSTTTTTTTAVTTTTTTTTSATGQTTTDNTPVSKPTKPKNLVIQESIYSVILNWDIVSDADGYSISRSFDRAKWKRIARFDGNINTYIDAEPLSDVACYYSVKAFKYNSNKKRVFSKKSNVVTMFYGINLYAAAHKKSVDLNWQKIDDASGYEIYFSTNNFDFELVNDITDSNITTYNHSNVTPFKTNYYFYIKAYKLNKNNKKEEIVTSNSVCASDVEAIVNGSATKPKTTFKTTNVQGKKAKLQEINTITDDDIKIFKKFEANYLTDDMSPYYKAYYVMMYINKKVTYASTSELWAKIANDNYVSAIFNKKIGQCAQYNGAMVAYLAYSGFNVKLLLGYRGYTSGNRWQHYWGQVKLKNGKYYVIEAGNYGNDGDWYYFFTPYSNTKKFLKCGKYVSGLG